MAIAETPLARAPEVEVAPDEAAALLELARVAVAAAARGRFELGRQAALRAAHGGSAGGRLGHGSASLEPRRGAAFVTLLERGELRGCIGLLDASRPLAESVAGAAAAAALHDWRFRPVFEDELEELTIEVSVLGPFVVLEDPTEFRLGVDGLLVERGLDRGLLLPEVATEHGFGTRAMLQAVCGKAGLSADAWRDRGTRVSAFRTKRFGGPAVPRGGTAVPSGGSLAAPTTT